MENENVNPQYQKGFNHGYALQRESSQQIEDALQRSVSFPEYHKGMKGGQAEAQREAFREQAKKGQQKGKEKGPEIG